MRDSWKKYAERGSMMVEALAMLGLITMVTPVLYKKAAERTTELQDINTASQMRTISNALDAYIADHYQDLSDEALGTITIANDEILPYLPYGFDIENSKLFDSYVFTAQNELINQGETNEHSAITGTVLAKARDDVPMLRAAKIASMVGANGGVVQGDQIQGVQGGWGGSISDFFGDESEVKNGSLAVSSVHAVTSSGGSGGGSDVSSEHVLYRDDSEGIEYNTMQTTLYMGGQNLEEVSKIIAGDDPMILVGSGKQVAVEDGLSVTGNLGVEGEGTISGATTVGSLVSNGAANIIGAITGGSTAELAGKLTVKDGAEITGTTNITGNTTIKTADNGGAEIAAAGTNIDVTLGNKGYAKFIDPNNTEKTVDINSENPHFLTANSGLAVKGGAAEVESATSSDYAAYIDGSILVKNNARVKGSMRLDGQLTASEIYGDTAIGGGLINPGEYNFKANADEVVVRGNDFSVGDRIVSNADGVLVGWQSDSKYSGLYANDTYIAMKRVNSENGKTSAIGMDDDMGVTVTSHNVSVEPTERFGVDVGSGEDVARFKINNNLVSLSFGNSANKINISPSSTVLRGGKGDTGVKVPYIALENGNQIVDADNILIDADDVVFDTNAAAPNDKDKGKSVRESGVRINRQGIIDVAHNDSDFSNRPSDDDSVGRTKTSGYIRADRFLANKAWTEAVKSTPAPGMSIHYGADGNSTSEYYDAYQVNPAYTSVMHDIKLTTRGGARLSDILPDFINKGIYVLDNTYQETKGKEDWSGYKVTKGTGGTPPIVGDAPGDCPSDDLNCVASPWLGFVPAPQCPPGYSKVITISPIRWKMSQAYAVGLNDSMTFPDYLLDQGYQDTVGLSLYTPTNPDVADFALREATTSGETEKHTHALASGTPLTFQTNTWLNTTVSGVRDSVTEKKTGDIRRADFLGWHAIMGFLYDGTNYAKWLKKVSADKDYGGKIVWNLFPVYNQEMAAIANVYCYFERRDMDTAPVWYWNTELVDGGASGHGYDQLTNFRSGFVKNNDAYNKRLNDPALGYKEVW